MSNNIHNVSRAVIISGESVLLAHPYSKNFIYLPGGHIEEGETAFQALQRELDEKLDIESNKLLFQGMCGIIESNVPKSFGQFCHSHEISFIFAYLLIETHKISSKEKTEDFHWHHIHHLDDIPLFPSCLKEYIPQ